MTGLSVIKDALLHFFFPHVCSGCGSDLLNKHTSLCIRCMHDLPSTYFEYHPGNPVEKLFWGRVPLQSASAQYYFTKESLIQRLMHQLKYKGDKDLGIQLGQMMGEQLMNSDRFKVDALVPLPLFPAKEKSRGYNQAGLLCKGMAESMKLPVLENLVTRPHHTETQTKKGRMERWKNIEGKFSLHDTASVRDKHILLVDDVVTTGATLESCSEELLKAENLRLSIVTLCIAMKW